MADSIKDSIKLLSVRPAKPISTITRNLPIIKDGSSREETMARFAKERPAQVSNESLINSAVDAYMGYVLTLSANFLKGLTFPRSELFKHVTCPNIKLGSVGLPFFTGQMADYVITQILPLENVYKKGLIDLEYQLAFNKAAQEAMQERFQVLAESIQQSYKKCWAKTKEDKKTVYAPVLTQEAAEKFLILRSNLRSFLNLNSGASSYEEMMQALKGLGATNNLYITATGFSNNTEQLVKALVWIISAYADWFDIDVVEQADVHSAVFMLIPFPDVEPEVIGDIMKGESLDEAQKDLFLNNLYRVFISNNLYINDVSLQKTADFILGLKTRHNELYKKVLNFANMYLPLDIKDE